jgi:NADH-quinone oxidoreductase subunit A
MQTLGSVITIVLALSAIIITLVYVISPKSPTGEKLSSYECGFEPYGSARSTFDIHFYLVAIIFIVFDIEVLFLLPWALAFSSYYALPIHIMAIFLAILTLGFYYEWKRNVLNWKSELV